MPVNKKNGDNSALFILTDQLIMTHITKQMERTLNKISPKLKTNLHKISFKVHMLNKTTQNLM